MSTSEVETRARAMGWMPKERYTGKNPWLPADEFVKKGDEIMPILQANNRALTDRLSATERQLAEQRTLYQASQEAIEELKRFNSEMARAKVKEQKKELTTALVEAKKAGNVEAEVEITEQLGEVNEALRAPPAKPAPKPVDTAPQVTPEAKTWMGENPWFGTDQRKTGYAMGLSNEWKAAGKQTGTKEFFDHVDQEMAKLFDQNSERRERAPKVGSTNNSEGGGGSEGGRTYADLPAEAKAACDRFALRLVGPGRAWKTKEDYRQHYLKQYDWSEG